MKIRRHLTVLFLTCGVAATNSCVNDQLGGNLLTEEVSILAKSGEISDTRSCVDNDNTGGNVGILWMPDDKIGVYGDAGTVNSPFSSANSANAPEAIFRGYLQEGEKPALAYFPYDQANDNSPSTAVKGNLILEQQFDMTTGKLHGDYKIGKVKYSSNQWEFTFDHLFSLLRFNIDASGTALAGDHLESITLTLPSERRLGGEFTVDINDGTVTWAGTPETANEIVMVWTDTPALESGKNYTGYITCAPDIRTGDAITITIRTANFIATFTKQSLVDFKANTCYTFPLTLSKYADEMEVTPRVGFSSFVFETSKNPGKILGTKLVPNSDKTATGTTTVTEESLEIGPYDITGCIPYLYNFRLVPTFTVSEGATVTVDGITQESGVTEQDFSKPVTYTVTKGEEIREYTVTVTNTGLPVVVVTQSEGMNEQWKEAGIYVRSKDSDWVETDKVSVYNADGTTDVAEALCGVRLRGNSTQKFPKKPFAIKLESKASVLGMPKHKRWVLLANWMDRTMIRNSVAFEVAHRVDSTYINGTENGIGWSPRGKSVELVIDGRHVGNYLLCEQIKIDGDRVDIKDAIEDIIADVTANPTVADCGYLLEFDDNYDEVDKFRTGRGLPCMFKDEVSSYSSEIFNSVKSYIENVESLIEANNYVEYEKVLDINSVIDYWFIQELVLNDEYKHPKSVYMIKDGDGKLTAGPVWDFDWLTFCFKANVDAMNSKYNGGWTCSNTNEWLYAKSKLAEKVWDWTEFGYVYDYVNDQPYMWYPLLFKSDSFCTAVSLRWPAIFSNLTGVTDFIDKVAEENRISEKYNSEMWPLVNIKSGVGSAFNGDEDMTYDEAIETMKRFYTERLSWMNGAISSKNFVTNAE